MYVGASIIMSNADNNSETDNTENKEQKEELMQTIYSIDYLNSLTMNELYNNS